MRLAFTRTSYLLVAALAACATTPAQRTYLAATHETVVTGLEAAYDGRGQHLYVQNTSTVPIVVTSVHLRECENIKTRCEVMRMRVPVGPGEKRRILTVNPESNELRHNFRYSWTWEPATVTPNLN